MTHRYLVFVAFVLIVIHYNASVIYLANSLWIITNDAGFIFLKYHQIVNIRRTSVGNKIVAHSDVIGATPVGAAPTASSFSS